MKSIRFGKNISPYMANIVDENKARKLNSVSVALCYCFLLRKNVFHEKVGQLFCHCFRCRLKNLLRDILVKRNEQRMLFIITVNNFDDLSETEVFKRFLLQHGL